MPLLPGQDQRHPVMDRAHGGIRRSRQDAVAVLSVPVVIQSCHIERAALPRKCEEILPLSSIPLIKARGRDEASAGLDAFPEQGFLRRCLRPGIDHQCP